MRTPIEVWNSVEKGDRAWVMGTIIAPIVIWWFYYGRHKYGTPKGMK